MCWVLFRRQKNEPTFSFISQHWKVNTLRPRHFADDILKSIFFNENVWILIQISLEFVPKGPINNVPALVQIMAWRRPGDKPLSEPMIVRLPMHICIIWPQWVKILAAGGVNHLPYTVKTMGSVPEGSTVQWHPFHFNKLSMLFCIITILYYESVGCDY